MNFFEFYNNNKGTKYEQLAFDCLINDLLRDNLQGNDKIREVPGINMEKDAPTSFVPSMFYIFAYFNPEKDKVGNIKFYDMVPMIFCTHATETTVTGLNFNYVPNDVRASFLDVITESYPQFYEKEVFMDGFKVNEKLGGRIVEPTVLSKILTMVKPKIGVDLNSVIRTYNRKNMLKSRMIEFDMWKYIPFLSFKDAVRGVNLAQVQLSLINSDK